MAQDSRALTENGGAHVVCATPGRAVQLIGERMLRTELVRILVLDGADSLLADSFRATTRRVLESLPRRKQVMVFAESFSEAFLARATSIMHEPQLMRLRKTDPGDGSLSCTIR